MRHRWARRVVLGSILAFPLLISAVASPSTSSSPQAGRFVRGFSVGVPVVVVELVLVGGVIFATRERRRLQVELDAARTRPRDVASLSSAMLSRAKAPARLSVFSYLRR